MILENKIGFYTLLHVPTNKFYVGSSVHVKIRVGVHKRELVKGVHVNPKLQGIFTSWEDFQVTVTYLDTIGEAKIWEQRILDLCGKSTQCCNVSLDVNNCFVGSSCREKAILSDHRGKCFIGVPKSDETRKKIAEANGKKVSIDGVVYPSIREASAAVGVSFPTVKKRLLGKSIIKYPNWKYL